MRRLIFSERARIDLSEIRDHIAQDKPHAAEVFTAQLARACEAPTEYPDLGRVGRRRGTRELASVWPYVIVYRVGPDAITIDRILHGARRR